MKFWGAAPIQLSLTGEYLQTWMASDHGRPQLQVPRILSEILIKQHQTHKNSPWSHLETGTLVSCCGHAV